MLAFVNFRNWQKIPADDAATSGVFRGGGTVRWPPLARHEIFLQATLYENCLLYTSDAADE